MTTNTLRQLEEAVERMEYTRKRSTVRDAKDVRSLLSEQYMQCDALVGKLLREQS